MLALVAGELAAARRVGEVRSEIDPSTHARVILSLVLGLSLGVLLDQTTEAQARTAVDAHLGLLRGG